MREKSTLFARKLAYTSVEGDDLSAIGHNCKAIFFSILFFPSGSIFDPPQVGQRYVIDH